MVDGTSNVAFPLINIVVIANHSSFRVLVDDGSSLTYGEGSGIRTICVFFFMVPCKNVYNNIIGWSFLATLDSITSHVHLKLKYRDEPGRPIVIKVASSELVTYKK
ncbi:hypothetical protein KIW84_054113 [Lathyrus oleraceus]|uniref:Uncharacterized protein n=1 Tax=Pisum sativum TaxID=3888 RepID=A0A9D4WX10_PEA|nr:hypothetical protein KIW84_054113 [Pisum sativum]